MKTWIPIIILIVTTFFYSCSSQKDSETSQKESNIPTVFVSNYPIQFFVERIAEPLVKIEFPAQTSADPAYWHPNPDDIIVMQQANLILLNGASYEQWVNNVTLPLSRIVYSSKGFEERLIPLQETVTHSHGPAGEHEHSGTAFTTWMDLSLAIEQAEAIYHALSMNWPEYQQQFKNRFEKLADDLRSIDEAISLTTSRAPDKAVIFSHPVYQYFQRRYGTNGKSLHWEPDEMPDDKMWSELREMLKDHPAKWMIWEDQPLESIRTGLKKLGLSSAVVSPCGNISQDGDFISVMQNNVKALKQIYP